MRPNTPTKWLYSEMVVGPNPFFVMTQIVRELRKCPGWPKNI